MYKYIFFILFFIALGYTASCSSINKKTTIKMEHHINSVGIEISKSKFDSLVVRYLGKIEKEIKLSIKEQITLVRLVNTIDHYNLSGDNKKLLDLFYQNIFANTLKELEADPWKGGCQYSQKYDLFIGGKPHQNSQYRIIEK